MYTYNKQSISQEDIDAVVEVLRSPFLTQGPKVKEFEDVICVYTGAKYAVAVANGGIALELACAALGVSKGDVVITSPMTFLASASCVLRAGGMVDFADVEASTINIDPHEIEKQITPHTKGIIPVHFAGQSCDMEEIYRIAQKHDLFVIEDAAHALGSSYNNHKVGSCIFSDITMFSFHPVKNITTGEGGVLTTNNEDMYEKLLRLRMYGVTKNPELMTAYDGPWYYEMHDLSTNCRLSDIHAALGVSQMKRLDAFVEKRRYLVEIYKEHLGGDTRFSFLREWENRHTAWHLWPLLINFDVVKKDKRTIFEELKNEGLNLQVHYLPVHWHPYFQQLGFKKGQYPHAKHYYRQTISLPLYVDLTDNDLKIIIGIIDKVVR